VALHALLKGFFDLSIRAEHDVQLRDLQTSRERTYSAPEPFIDTLSSRELRNTFVLTVIATCARVEVFRQTLGYRQCTVPGIEGLLPLLIALRVSKARKPAHKTGDNGQAIPPLSPSSQRWTTGILGEVGPAALMAVASVLASRVSATPRSTYICPIAMGGRQRTVFLQCAGLLLDFYILTSVGALLKKRRTSGSSRPSKAPVILGSLLIVRNQ
jgi:hypothetical protein